MVRDAGSGGRSVDDGAIYNRVGAILNSVGVWRQDNRLGAILNSVGVWVLWCNIWCMEYLSGRIIL